MSFNFSEWALRHKSFILFFIILTTLAGIYSYGALGRKEDPDFTIKTMIVGAVWSGAGTVEMADQVTDKLELALQAIPEIDYTKSSTRAGSTTVIVQLRSDTNAAEVPDVWYRVRKTIQDAKAQGKFPATMGGPYFNDDFGDTFGNIYALTGDGYSYPQLKAYADALRDRMRALPEVAKVEFQGEQAERIFIEYQSAKLASLGVSPQVIAQAVNATNDVSPAGLIETGSERIRLKVSGAFGSLDAIRNIGIATTDGRNFRLGDIATVSRGLVDPPELKLHVNGREAIGLAISARKGGSITKLGESLAEVVAAYQAELPVGVEIHTVADQPVVVEEAVGEFTKSLAEAVVIVMAVSFLSLGFRPGIVVALCIPLVLGATFAAMKGFGIDLQRISLGALIIALGLLVDDAMIVVESIESHLEMGWDKARAAISAYAATATPMLIGTLITITGFIPIGFAEGTASEYVRSLFHVVAISLILSWIVAVLVTPYIAFQILPEPKPGAHGEAGGHQASHSGRGYALFRRLVSQCLERRVLVIAATAGAFVAAMAIFAFAVPKQFFPASDRPELLIDLRLPHNASFAATERAARRMEAVLAGDKDIISTSTYIGGGAPRFYLPLDVQTPDLALAQMVVLTKGGHARERVAAKVENALATGFPELRGRVAGLENGPPVGQPLQLRLSGADHEQIRASAEAVEALLRRTPHLRGVNSDYGERLKTVQLEVDEDKARALGISYDALRQALEGSLEGAPITVLRDGDKSVLLLARLNEAERTNLATLPYAKIPTASGAYVPLSQVARLVRVDRTLAALAQEPPGDHHGLRRRGRRPAGPGPGPDRAGSRAGEGAAARRREADRRRRDRGERVQPGAGVRGPARGGRPHLRPADGAAAEHQEDAAGPRHGAAGADRGRTDAWPLFQIPFGFVAMLGSLSLFGMVIRNSVILVARVDELVASGVALQLAIVDATVHRVRPILLTATAAILAMIPLTRSVFWGPMAFATMGGLFVATLLTLFFVPALYLFAFQKDRAPVEPEVAA
jgi:multidrug efflux pump